MIDEPSTALSYGNHLNQAASHVKTERNILLSVRKRAHGRLNYAIPRCPNVVLSQLRMTLHYARMDK